MGTEKNEITSNRKVNRKEEKREKNKKEILKLMGRDCYRRIKGRLRQVRWCDNDNANTPEKEEQDKNK